MTNGIMGSLHPPIALLKTSQEVGGSLKGVGGGTEESTSALCSGTKIVFAPLDVFFPPSSSKVIPKCVEIHQVKMENLASSSINSPAAVT